MQDLPRFPAFLGEKMKKYAFFCELDLLFLKNELNCGSEQNSS